MFGGGGGEPGLCMKGWETGSMYVGGGGGGSTS